MSADIIPLRAAAPQPSLAPLLSLTAPGMNSVNAIILDRMQSEIPLIPTLAGHLIAGGGKRVLVVSGRLDSAPCRHKLAYQTLTFVVRKVWIAGAP